MKVLICGSRKWTKEFSTPIKEVIDDLEPGDTVIHGAAPGVDTIAGELAKIRGDLNIEEFIAEWDVYGRRAGPIRNIKMLDEKPDIVYAFPVTDSIGTKHTISHARARKIPTVVYGE